jgi:hypothetical protein
MAYTTWFQHFCVAEGTTVRVDGLQRADRVSLTPAGDATVDAVANASGEARLQLPVTEAVGKGTFSIDGPHVRRTFKNVELAGGDVHNFTSYAWRSPPNPAGNLAGVRESRDLSTPKRAAGHLCIRV